MIDVRIAEEKDVEGIRDLFYAAYGSNYAYPSFYDLQVLKKMVFDDDTYLLVAVDTETERVLGTASVIFDLGEYGDLVGEFGRLVVHPDGRKRGIGKKLMNARLEGAKDRLHVGFVENRVAHPFSQIISDRYDFAAAGFLPQKHKFEARESLALYLRYFDDALKLRRNNPRIIPEGFLLAQHILEACKIDPDVIIDNESPAYPDESEFEIEEMTSKGYAPLLRFVRAIANKKEIFGRAEIRQGLFRLKATKSYYVIAREKGQLVGAVGYTIEENEQTATIFELVSLNTRPIRCLLKYVIDKCRSDFDLEYIETDVSAYSPRMQRTLLELQFFPVGYMPAFTFQRAERCDAIRMARLFVPATLDECDLIDATQDVADIVMKNFSTHQLLPRLIEALPNVRLFSGLTEEQIKRLAEICSIQHYPSQTTLFEKGQASDQTFVVLNGEINIRSEAGETAYKLGTISDGGCLGETTLLSEKPHTVSAETSKETEAAIIEKDSLIALIRRRPDIGVILYRNLAKSLGNKLRDLDADVVNIHSTS